MHLEFKIDGDGDEEENEIIYLNFKSSIFLCSRFLRVDFVFLCKFHSYLRRNLFIHSWLCPPALIAVFTQSQALCVLFHKQLAKLNLVLNA